MTSGLTSGRVVDWRLEEWSRWQTDGFMAGMSTTTAITGRTLGESVMLAMCSNTMITTQQMRGANANLMMSGVSWSSSHWETSGWHDADECSNDRKEQMRSSDTLFEAKSMIQLISSLCRGNDVATFSGIEVDPSESLADTAAQSGIIDVRPFRKAEEALFHKFGLKPRVISGDNQAVGIGGRAKVLGKVEMPSGMGGVNGIVKYTLVDSPGVPPLTPVSLLKQVGAVIDLNSNTMDLKKIETMTTLRTLPSGHVAHKLTEFAPGSWKAPTSEQTELFQVKTDAFRPVTLPGEIKSRSSKQCVGFSSGFVYTVPDRSYPTPSHHQHDPDLCVDDAMSSNFLFDDQLAQRTSGFECSFASRVPQRLVG